MLGEIVKILREKLSLSYQHENAKKIKFCGNLVVKIQLELIRKLKFYERFLKTDIDVLVMRSSRNFKKMF